MIQQHHQYLMKQLNVEHWPTDYVCQWVKGVSELSINYSKQFELNQIDGKKLSVIELTDLRDYLDVNLKQQLTLHKSIQSLLQIKHDLNKETLHNLIFNVHNRIVFILNQIERLENCSCHLNECEKCLKIKKYDIVSSASHLALSYRRLISWLVRIPFTRLKPFENFREEINNEMRSFLKLFRKNSAEKFVKEIMFKLNTMLNYCKRMLNYCDRNFDEENGKIGCAFSCCYLEKVKIRRQNPDQILGLKLTSLQDGIFTIAEIVRDSSADECSQLNVEDDIIFVDSQVVIGWNSENIIKLLEDCFSTNGVISLVLRKMPKDHINSIKQQKNLALIYKNHHSNRINNFKKQQNSNKPTNGHQRKLSFSDMFVSEEFVINDSSDEEEENYDSKLSSNEQLNKEMRDLSNKANTNSGDEMTKSNSNTLYEKNKSKKDGDASNKKNKAKLDKKPSRNRLIKSMQNLFFYDKTRSESAERIESSSSNESSKKLERKKSVEETSPKQAIDSNTKSDMFKLLFSNKRWDSSKKNSFEYETTPDTPNLINVKRIDSFKRNDPQMLSNYSPNLSIKTVSSKPPIDKRSYKMQTQKPAMQGWLYKQRQSSSSMSSGTNSPINNNNPQNTLIRNQLNRPIKWKKYWCVLMKDYITFYKQSDDKTPKDFLLLKDFEIKEGSKKHGFILTDNLKQVSHEFYSEQMDEYNEWYQALIDLRNRLNGEPTTSLSSTSLSSSSGYDTLGLNSSLNRDDFSSAPSLPDSSTFNRKNNLQLKLSTIIDMNDDSINYQPNSNDKTSNQYSPPTLATLQQQHQQQSFSSSRESSPDISNSNSKLHSRDSSPGLNYPYLQELEQCTSESDAEIVYSRNFDVLKSNNAKNSQIAVASQIASTNAIAGINNISNKQKSSSPSPSSASSMTKFVYSDDPNDQSQYIKSNKSASLPGTLQLCVGSFLNSNNKQKIPEMEMNKHSIKPTIENNKLISQASKQSINEKTQMPLNPASPKRPPIATQSTYQPSLPSNYLLSSLSNENNAPVLSMQTTHSKTPNSTYQAMPSSPFNIHNKQLVLNNPSSIQVNRHQQKPNLPPPGGYYYPQAQNPFLKPKTPPLNNISKINVQVVRPYEQSMGQKPSDLLLPRSSITQLNKFNFLPNEYHQQQTLYSHSLPKAPTYVTTPIGLQSPNSPIVYRTELTILPSSFNNSIAPSTATSSASSIGYSSPHNLPKQINSNQYK